MLWGALANATSGMNSMSVQLGTISQNIANVNTTAYKTENTTFQTQLSEQLATPNNPNTGDTGSTQVFGVQPVNTYEISTQGNLLSTNQYSDIAINGSGFFITEPPSSTGGAPTAPTSLATSTSTAYTRDGSFSQLADGTGKSYFVTSGGNYLMGWMPDPKTGTISSSATQTLQPVYITPTTAMPAVATTAASLVANVPADAAITQDPQTSTVPITDAGGNPQNLTLTWTRSSGNTWTVAATGATGGGTPSGSYTVTMDNTGAITSPSPATQAFSVNWGVPGTTTPSVNLTTYRPSYSTQSTTIPVYDSQSGAHNLSLEFEKSGANSWYLHFGTSESGASISTAPVPITFDGAGNIISPTSTTVNATWADGATSSVDINLSKLTQYVSNGQIQVASSQQNGYPSGHLSSYQFDTQGNLNATYDNGQSRTLFKVPVATFTAPDNLNPTSGNMFQLTQNAGTVTVQGVNQIGNNSTIVGGSLEQSNVDLGTQFTDMILTQKAYASNAEVLRAANQMLMTARDLQN